MLLEQPCVPETTAGKHSLGARWNEQCEWTGVRLEDLLTRAGLSDRAVEVILEGADTGEFKDPDPKTPGVIPYARSLPLQKARRPEVMPRMEHAASQIQDSRDLSKGSFIVPVP